MLSQIAGSSLHLALPSNGKSQPMMRLDQDDDLRRLNGLIRTRNANAVEITRVIGRPIQLAHNRRMHCELDIRYRLGAIGSPSG